MLRIWRLLILSLNPLCQKSEVDHHNRVLLDDPIKQTIPMSEITSSSLLQRMRASTARRWQEEESIDCDRMHQTLVQDSNTM